MLSKDVPKHARCDVCAKCRSKFMSGLEGCCYGRDGLTCTACSGNPLTPMAVPTGPVEIPPELHQLMSILNRQA